MHTHKDKHELKLTHTHTLTRTKWKSQLCMRVDDMRQRDLISKSKLEVLALVLVVLIGIALFASAGVLHARNIFLQIPHGTIQIHTCREGHVDAAESGVKGCTECTLESSR